MRIYLVRHGQTDLNQRKCYYGVTEAELTEEGIFQARQLGEFFKEMHWDRIIVSPLKRAVDTAMYVTGCDQGDFLPESFELEPRLQEQNFGIFEGKTYQKLCEEYPQELQAWNQNFSDFCIPEGESFADVRKRVESWLYDLCNPISEDPRLDDKTSGKEAQILVVAHKGTFGHLLAAMLGLPLDGYWNFVFDQGCYSMVDLQDGYAILRKLNQSIQP